MARLPSSLEEIACLYAGMWVRNNAHRSPRYAVQLHGKGGMFVGFGETALEAALEAVEEQGRWIRQNCSSESTRSTTKPGRHSSTDASTTSASTSTESTSTSPNGEDTSRLRTTLYDNRRREIPS